MADKTIEEAVTQGYGDKVFENRYPVAYVFLTVPPETVDVNVHPNKREIRFDEPDRIRELIRRSIFEKLNTRDGVGRFQENSILKENSVPETGEEPGIREEGMPFRRPVSGEPAGIQEKLDVEVISVRRAPAEAPGPGETGHPAPVSSAVHKTETTHENDFSPEDPRYGKEESRKFDLSSLTVLGVIFLTYIAAYDEEFFYLIDQHAAHERVFYEQFLDAFYRQESAPQILMTPLIRETGLKFASSGESGWMSLTDGSGFRVEEFGGRSLKISAISSHMDLAEAERFLDDYMDSVTDSTDFRDQKTLDRIILRSCKAAVKAHDRLSADEVRTLLRDLSRCSNPFSCPHGRPAIIRMSKREMEKMFKRIV